MKTMKTLTALALATGNVHAEAFAQAFENSMAAQAKIDCEVEQDLRQKYSLPNGKGMVLVSSHYSSVSADYGCSWQGMDHDLNAKRIAIWGLLANPSSEYFNVTIRDSKGEGRAFIQRRGQGNVAGYAQNDSADGGKKGKDAAFVMDY